MNRAIRLPVALLALSSGLDLAQPRTARAQGGVPNCADLPNPIYMGGTTAVIPVIRLFGARLKQVGVTLLWNELDDGCNSENLLANGYPPGQQQRVVFSQYDEDPLQKGKVIATTCNGGVNKVPDLVINDVAYSSCPFAYLAGGGGKATLPAGLKEFTGPVQGLVPIVPSSYTFYNDITVEELRALYTCGASGGILTFSNKDLIYDYDHLKSGMRELWARGMGLANGAAMIASIGFGSSSPLSAESMVTTVAGSTAPDQTFGYTSTEFFDQGRDLVRGLKVRGVKQELAYWPDSDMTSVDKSNLRAGRYTLQAPLRLVAAVDVNGVPTNPGAKNLIDWFQGNPGSAPLPFDVIEIYAQRGVVPQCAMKVIQQGDTPYFGHYSHPQPCHCSFEFLATGKTNCVPCADVDAGTCPPNTMCSHGYCEPVN